MVIVDYRNVAKIATYSILSGSVACTFPTEAEEIANRLVKRLFCIRLDYPAEQIFFANDKKPYWRSAYINKWYADRGQEPVVYKGNREGRPWPFTTPEAVMEQLYHQIKMDAGHLLEATVVEDTGLEADDIFGLLATSTAESVVGISSDSDWRQLCSNRITVLDPATNAKYVEPYDLRIKMISGDSGDNVKGCPKRKKDGSAGTTCWGATGAIKLLTEVNWQAKVDPDILDRNRVLTQLPCPLWDLKVAVESLKGCMVTPAAGYGLDYYGLTAPVRQELRDKAARDAWILRLRAQLQQNNKEAQNAV